ncbi:hypothetical protein N7539_001596 [Penicillium diatomitis]|uniref:Mid2 domain-containing protein n=1 Tax=Penicillium diatomitis TaxID=2819901 RepID=A0A9X0C088_9EURO|nr:uncharacterized protein N7539_001596 [Penicillium diatomitis]KAJ5492850.1 hypothetical protein N7539_001596 [Penicillium diatomitis]
MAHHGHRHDHIGRFSRARQHLHDNDQDTRLLSNNGEDIAPHTILESHILRDDTNCQDPCVSVENRPQSGETPDSSPGSSNALPKRQEPEIAIVTVVETVVQMLDSNLKTLPESASVSLSLTLSESALEIRSLGDSTATLTTDPASSTASTGSLTVTASLSSTKQSATSVPSRPSSAAVSPALRSSSRHVPSPATTITPGSKPTSAFKVGSIIPTSLHSNSTTLAINTSVSLLAPISTADASPSEDPGSATSPSNSAPTSDQTHSPTPESGIDPTTSKIVGGVVGSVAGLAMIFIVLFYLFRRRKMMFKQRNSAALPLPSDDGGTTRQMSTISSNEPLFSASYLSPAFAKRWRHSTMTVRSDSTVSSSTPSERGFQKISGRKIPPVLAHGGDGYGGTGDESSPTYPGLSPVSPGGASAMGSALTSPLSQAPPPTLPHGMVLDTNYTREAEEGLESPIRSSPVHLPISSAVSVASPTTVTPTSPIAQPQSAIAVIPRRPDGLGRSFPSYDGSRSSRFTESID